MKEKVNQNKDYCTELAKYIIKCPKIPKTTAITLPQNLFSNELVSKLERYTLLVNLTLRFCFENIDDDEFLDLFKSNCEELFHIGEGFRNEDKHFEDTTPISALLNIGSEKNFTVIVDRYRHRLTPIQSGKPEIQQKLAIYYLLSASQILFGIYRSWKVANLKLRLANSHSIVVSENNTDLSFAYELVQGRNETYQLIPAIEGYFQGRSHLINFKPHLLDNKSFLDKLHKLESAYPFVSGHEEGPKARVKKAKDKWEPLFKNIDAYIQKFKRDGHKLSKCQALALDEVVSEARNKGIWKGGDIEKRKFRKSLRESYNRTKKVT